MHLQVSLPNIKQFHNCPRSKREEQRAFNVNFLISSTKQKFQKFATQRRNERGVGRQYSFSQKKQQQQQIVAKLKSVLRFMLLVKRLRAGSRKIFRMLWFHNKPEICSLYLVSKKWTHFFRHLKIQRFDCDWETNVKVKQIYLTKFRQNHAHRILEDSTKSPKF